MPHTFPEYESFDGLGLASLVQRGVVSPLELLDAAIERVELWNPKINAVIIKMYDYARESIHSTLPFGPFNGVPILLKDLFSECVGVPIYYGSRFAYNNKWIAPFENECVLRLKNAGTVLIGKTNVPEFGLSALTEPELFGPTHNPWDIRYASGGSSGGAAAAVAARMVPVAHGGDGGGSLRIPAAYNGVFGFKPSRGRTPTGPFYLRVWQGMVVQNVISRTVRDSAAMLDILAGPELGSPISLPKPRQSFLEQLDSPLRRLRIAMIAKPFFPAEVDPDYINALKQAGKLCEELGHHVEATSFKIDDDVPYAFLIIMAAETSAVLKQLIKAIGKKPKAHELEKQTALLCHSGDKFSASDYAWAMQKLDQTARQLTEFFEKYDMIMTPTVHCPPPKVGENKLNTQERFTAKILHYLPYNSSVKELLQRASLKNFSYLSFTALFNIGGQPAMSVPLYEDKKGMPIGIQFAGRYEQDAELYQLAAELEKTKPWDQKKPIFQDSTQKNS